MKKVEYLFYEWMIISKQIDRNAYSELSDDGLEALRKEFIEVLNKSTFINIQ